MYIAVLDLVSTAKFIRIEKTATRGSLPNPKIEIIMVSSFTLNEIENKVLDQIFPEESYFVNM